MLLGMLTQATPTGQPQAFRPGVNQFRAKGVSYRSVLDSARVFVSLPLPLSSSAAALGPTTDTLLPTLLDAVTSGRGPDVRAPTSAPPARQSLITL